MKGCMKNIKWMKWTKNFLIGVASAIFLLLFYRCPFRLLLGISCPGCGMTRAFCALLRFDLQEAFHAHPLFPIVLVVAMYDILEKNGKLCFSEKTKNGFLAVFGILFLILYLMRLITGSDIVQFCPEDGVIFQLHSYVSAA